MSSEELNERATPELGGQLAWEARVGRPVGFAALAAALLTVVSFAVQLPLLRHSKDEAQYLTSVHKHASAYVLSGILQFVAFIAVGAVLWYLARAATYRRAQASSPIAQVLAVAGPILFGIAGAVGPFVIRHVAAQFVAGTDHTVKHAKHVASSGSAQSLSLITPIAGLLFIFAMIMNNINAMRAGLVSGFIGIIGVIAAVLFLIPFGPPQVLLLFWLIAVSMVVLDRWPGGRGPAWASGEAIKWPTAMERRGMAPGGPGRGGQRGRQAPPEASANGEPEDTRLVEEAKPAQTRTSRKRKRKQGRKH